MKRKLLFTISFMLGSKLRDGSSPRIKICSEQKRKHVDANIVNISPLPPQKKPSFFKDNFLGTLGNACIFIYRQQN